MILIPILGAGALGYLGFELWDSMKTKPKGKLSVPPILNVPNSPRLSPVAPPVTDPLPKLVPMTTTPAGHPISVLVVTNPQTGKPETEYQTARIGTAIPAAHALYDYIKAHGTSRSSQFDQLVSDFQKAHNEDPGAKTQTGGPLIVTGLYDLPTSGTLTIYTGDPVPSDPAAPVPPNAPGATAPAYMSASNLYAYLKKNGTKKTPDLAALVKRFQHDVNTDTKFPGPAFPFDLKLVKTKLAEDGIYGNGTADALKVATLERIAP